MLMFKCDTDDMKEHIIILNLYKKKNHKSNKKLNVILEEIKKLKYVKKVYFLIEKEINNI